PTALLAAPLMHDAAARAPAFLLLADVDDAAWLADALHAGARGVLHRSASATEIGAAVEAAGAGLAILPLGAAGALLAAIPRAAARRPAEPPAQPLTPREAEILGMLAEGLGNKIIAARLRISEHTVKTHVASIFGKLRVETRAEAVAVGARLGLIML
ncbi:MAG TPA: response regulator transcription factor, partial [Gemmatimonadaceae bacterium]|nr:response regulator transcription factor [Gemmatimonadaceae bacterium]